MSTIDNTDPTAMRGRIVALSTTNWHDDQWMNRQHICSRLAARGWRVVYSNGALRLDGWRSARWHRAPWFDWIETQGNLRIVHAGRLTARFDRFSFLARHAVRRHAKMLIDAGGGRPDWVVVFNPRLADYVQHFASARLAYHVYDHFPGFPAWNEKLQFNHNQLIQAAHLLTTSSNLIAQDLPPTGRDRAIVMPNAADVAAFVAGERAACPDDLAATSPPRILYAGAVNAKLDFNIMRTCAERRPNHHWIILGSVNLCAENSHAYQQFRKLKNVHIMGSRPRMSIPAYLAHSDVATVPYRLDGKWSLHGSPNKLPEALAVGKPIIATPIPTTDAFASVVALASTPEEWLDALDAAIAGQGIGSPEARRQVAREHDWEGWVDRYEAMLLAPPHGKTQAVQIENRWVPGPADAPELDAGGASSWRA